MEGFPYGRNGKAIAPLTLNKIEQIKITAKEKDYIDNKGLNNVYYKDYILYWKIWESNKEEINDLIYPKLPMNMDKKNKNNRVRYIISQLKKENKIENVGSLAKSFWIMKK